jgi:hypothetical protein
MSVLLQAVGALWGILVLAYVVLVIYRSTVALHEDDSLHISAGESRFETEQREVVKHMAALDSKCNKLGYAALATTLVLAGVWVYTIIQAAPV